MFPRLNQHVFEKSSLSSTKLDAKLYRNMLLGVSARVVYFEKKRRF
jgi:hypothetical protein